MLQDDMAPGAEQYVGSADGQAGYCIEIYVSPDNQVQSVGVSQRPKDAEGVGRDVEALRRRCRWCRKSSNPAGRCLWATPIRGPSAHDQMMQGYGQGSLSSAGRGLSVRKVFDRG